MIAALIAVAGLLQDEPSDAARTARKSLDALRADVGRLQVLYDHLRAGFESQERMEKEAREFQDLRAATVQSMDALVASATAGLETTPDDPGLLDVRSEAHLIYQKNDLALPDLRKLASLRPDDVVLRAKLGRVEHSVNRFEDAARNLAICAKKDPADRSVRLLLAECGYALHRFEKVRADLVELLKEKDLTPLQKERAELLKGWCEDYVDLWKKELDARAKEEKADDLPRVRMTTSRGAIDVELFENEAPNAVGSFVGLVEKRFFDGLKFHRVIPGFMAQTGCPKGDGSGGPGYRFADEVGAGHRRHFRGSLSMANAGPDTNGSQFYVTHLPTEWLNGKHTVFGRVVAGQEVVDALQTGDGIVKAEVLRKRAHEYAVRPVDEK